jgi:hypothetical protein
MFMLGWDMYRFDKNCIGTSYIELVFFRPEGSTGHLRIPVRLGYET